MVVQHGCYNCTARWVGEQRSLDKSLFGWYAEPMDNPGAHAQGRLRALQEAGIRNPHPERVLEAVFATHSAFFDRHDLVQVKYEMLRAHQVDGVCASEAARRFGFSRQTLYTLLSAFRQEGVTGLLPQKRGPKGPYKVTPEMLVLVETTLRERPSVSAAELAELLHEAFGVELHPRTLARVLHKKKHHTGAR